MTTTFYLCVLEGQIRLIPGDKMPVKPDKYSYNFEAYNLVYREYESSIQTAIKESVLCADQEKAVKRIAHGQTILELEKAKAHYCKEGEVYGPFEAEYKTEWRQYCQQMNGSGCREKCKPIPASHGAMDCKFKDKPHEVVAILSDPLRDEQSSKLMPCPFCASSPEWINEAIPDSHYYIRCPNCHIVMKEDRRDKVIGMWNNRAKRDEQVKEEDQEDFLLHLVDVVACFTAEQNQYYSTPVRKELIEKARSTYKTATRKQ